MNPASTLGDDALMDRVEEVVREMCQGDRWRMSIPVHAEDSDMVIIELLARYRASRRPLPDAEMTP